MSVDISTQAVNETLTKRDLNQRIVIYREPGQGVVIEYHRRIAQYDPSNNQIGPAIDYTMRCVPGDSSSFPTVLTNLDNIGDTIATSRGLIGVGP